LQYAKNGCNRQNCNTKIWLGGVATDVVAIGLRKVYFGVAIGFSLLQHNGVLLQHHGVLQGIA